MRTEEKSKMVVFSASPSNSIKVGDIVELLPTNNRNRQLRLQDKKIYWKVLQIRPVICFDGEIGYDIEAIGTEHTRWVTRDDIKIDTFRENV
jgi:hypothetical protein